MTATRSIPTDAEIRNRLEGVRRYNAYFARETDTKGHSLAHHQVSPGKLWLIMTREWGVDPKRFGVKPVAATVTADPEPQA